MNNMTTNVEKKELVQEKVYYDQSDMQGEMMRYRANSSSYKYGMLAIIFSVLASFISLNSIKWTTFDVIIKKANYPKNYEITSREIPEFWGKCHADGTIGKLISRIPKGDPFGLMGMSLYDRTAPEFSYGIGVTYAGGELPEGEFSIETIPSHTYVVFKIVGKMPQAFQEAYRYICTEFFPVSSYQPCGVEIEAYPSDDTQNPDYTCELWIAVEKKVVSKIYELKNKEEITK